MEILDTETELNLAMIPQARWLLDIKNRFRKDVYFWHRDTPYQDNLQKVYVAFDEVRDNGACRLNGEYLLHFGYKDLPKKQMNLVFENGRANTYLDLKSFFPNQDEGLFDIDFEFLSKNGASKGQTKAPFWLKKKREYHFNLKLSRQDQRLQVQMEHPSLNGKQQIFYNINDRIGLQNVQFKQGKAEFFLNPVADKVRLYVWHAPKPNQLDISKVVSNRKK